MDDLQRMMSLASETRQPTEPTNTNELKTDEIVRIPSVEVANADELYAMARGHMRSKKLGQFGSHTLLLERQIAKDFHRLYPALRPCLKEVDCERRLFRRKTYTLRLVTFLLYGLFLYALYRYILAVHEVPGHDLSRLWGEPAIFWLFSLTGLGVANYMFRAGRLSNLQKIATSFGATFNRRLNGLRDKSQYSVDLIATDRATEEGCGERAHQWAFIALWLGELWHFYDRYVTVASWRSMSSLIFAAFLFCLVKWVAILATVLILVQNAPDLTGDAMAMTVFLLIIVASSMSWNLLPNGGASNNLWQDYFTKAISGQEPDEVFNNAVATKIARMLGSIRDLHYHSNKG